MIYHIIYRQHKRNMFNMGIPTALSSLLYWTISKTVKAILLRLKIVSMIHFADNIEMVAKNEVDYNVQLKNW